MATGAARRDSREARQAGSTVTAEALFAPALDGSPGGRHAFCTRRGGVSEGAYATLNCGLSGEDRPERVRENRARAAAAAGADPARLVSLYQVHGTEVVTVREPWPDDERPRADAMVTRAPGMALGVVTADCAPVLFADRAAGVVGAAHAGWRGAAAGVLEATVAAMEALGAERGRIVAAIGPCIGARSYEVGPDLRGAVLAAAKGPSGGEAFFADGARPGRWLFDLARYCASRLAPLCRVEQPWADGSADTLADEARFFSHRRRTLAGGGPLGHQISVVVA
jgi:polyphenol oxidase